MAPRREGNRLGSTDAEGSGRRHGLAFIVEGFPTLGLGLVQAGEKEDEAADVSPAVLQEPEPDEGL
eukprot:13884871-Heterocapsa_arctica.AAC.1